MKLNYAFDGCRTILLSFAAIVCAAAILALIMISLLP